MLDNRKAGAPQRFTSIICVCAVGEPASWIMAYALKRAKEKVTIVVGDDTDLLVLHYEHLQVGEVMNEPTRH